MFSTSDKRYMQMALRLAKKAENLNEVPVGALLILNNEIIGRGFNQPIGKSDPSAHAEVIAIRQAAKKINNYRLAGSTLYTTLEPCPMCAGLIVHARIKRLVIATTDTRTGCCGSVLNITNGSPFNHKVEVTLGVFEEEAKKQLQAFFKARRKS